MSTETRQELESKARDLTRKLGYVSEMYRLCTRLMIASEAMMKLMDNNGTNDETFGQAIADIAGRSRAKFEICETWLAKNQPTLDKMTDRLANWDEDHA